MKWASLLQSARVNGCALRTMVSWINCSLTDQYCRFSQNIAKVTPKINYFYHQKTYLQGQSIEKTNYLILKKNFTVTDWQWCFLRNILLTWLWTLIRRMSVFIIKTVMFWVDLSDMYIHSNKRTADWCHCFLFQNKNKMFFGYFDPEHIFLDNENK